MAVIQLLVKRRANRVQLFRSLASSHEVYGPETAGRGVPDVIIADQHGVETWKARLDEYRTSESQCLLPVLLLVNKGEQRKALDLLGNGVDDVVNLPVTRAELGARLHNLVRIRRLSEAQADQVDNLASKNRLLKEEVEYATARMKQAFAETIATLTHAAEYKDVETGAHVKRVSHFTTRLADVLGCNRELREQLFYATPMHDIGKIGVPDAVLLKKERLTSDEWELIKTHTSIGYRILKDQDSPYTQLGAEIALNHHERYDATGYPSAHGGDDVPFAAYLMSISDVYDALRSPRPYKAEMTHKEACSIIFDGDGRTRKEHFHPDAYNAFCRCADDFADIYAAFCESGHETGKD